MKTPEPDEYQDFLFESGISSGDGSDLKFIKLIRPYTTAEDMFTVFFFVAFIQLIKAFKVKR